MNIVDLNEYIWYPIIKRSGFYCPFLATEKALKYHVFIKMHNSMRKVCRSYKDMFLFYCTKSSNQLIQYHFSLRYSFVIFVTRSNRRKQSIWFHSCNCIGRSKMGSLNKEQNVIKIVFRYFLRDSVIGNICPSMAVIGGISQRR